MKEVLFGMCDGVCTSGSLLLGTALLALSSEYEDGTTKLISIGSGGLMTVAAIAHLVDTFQKAGIED